MSMNTNKTTIHFTSDLHIFHKNIIKYSNRPFNDVEHMNTVLVDNINAAVKPDDTLYSLGDLGFAPIGDIIGWLNRINCKNVHLLLGNHDKILRKNKDLITQSCPHIRYAYDMKEINHNGQFIVLGHYGMRVWNKSHHGAWHLFGHSHGSLPPHGKSVDVGVDSPYITGKAEYRPFSFQEIARFMKNRDIAKEDYHGEDE